MKTTVKAAIVITAVAGCCFFSSASFADPEKAFEAGKTAAGVPKVDDRDFEQRTRDYVKDRGAGKDTPFFNDNTKPKSPPPPSPPQKPK